ncbi:MAG: AAA family ATPase [Candidatus Kryptoniota bacterium]
MENIKVDKEILEKYGIKVEEEDYKPVVLIYGKKGVGKTTTALSLPGSYLALSFDGQTTIIKQMLARNDVKVVNIASLVANIEPLLGGKIAIELAIHILENNTADNILIDGIEMLNMYAERKMRYENKLELVGGIKDRNIWKERNAYVDQIHNLAVKQANVFVIYTTFEGVQEVEGEEENVAQVVPKYVARMMYASNVILHQVMKKYPSQKINRYFVEVDSDKGNIIFRTGDVLDVTDFKPLVSKEKYELLKEKKFKARIVVEEPKVKDKEEPKENVPVKEETPKVAEPPKVEENKEPPKVGGNTGEPEVGKEGKSIDDLLEGL